jgi:RNA polymerase sigma factor (sigma-70 family)
LTEFTEKFWETTYRNQISKMIGICYRYVANRQAAEDLAHDAFIMAMDKCGSFKGRGRFESWLRTITVNKALHYLRDMKRQSQFDDWMLNQSVEMETVDNDTHENIINQAGYSEKELLDIVNSLPEHHRLVFNLYVIDKFTHAQIGEELGISPGTSKSHLARARKKLRKLLYQKVYNEPDKKKAKMALFLFAFPVNFGFVDRLYQRAFRIFEIQPRNLNFVNSINISKASIPIFKPLLFSVKLLFIASVSVVLVTIVVIIKKIHFTQEQNTEYKTEVIDSAQKEQFTNESNLIKKRTLTNSVLKTATKSHDSIILSINNKKDTSMKKLNYLGALLITASGIVLNSSGQVMYENIDEFGVYCDNWALVEKDDLKGFVDASGKEVVEPKYDQINEFDEYHYSWALVEKDKLKGFIDTLGKEIVEVKYDEISEFDEYRQGWALIEKDNLKGFIDENGNEIVKVKYDEISEFGEYKRDWMYVKKDGLWGAIDKNGQEVLKPEIKKIENINSNAETVETGLNLGDNIQNIFTLNPTDSCIIEYYRDKGGYIINGNKKEVFNRMNEKYFVSDESISFSTDNNMIYCKLSKYKFKDKQGMIYIDNEKVGEVSKSDILILHHKKRVNAYNRNRVKILE